VADGRAVHTPEENHSQNKGENDSLIEFNHLMIGLVKNKFCTGVLNNPYLEIVWNKNACNTSKVFVCMNMSFNPMV